MKLIYSINGTVYETTKTNEQVEIIIKKEQSKNKVVVKALTNLTLINATEEYDYTFKKTDLFFLNGYQSWTDTKEFSYDEDLKNVRKIPGFLDNMFKFSSYGDTFFVETKKGVFHAYDISYIKDRLFIGSYNYKNAYLITKYYKKKNKIELVSDVKGKVLMTGNEFTVFDYIYTENQEEGLASYYNALTPKTNHKIFGYTSWYNHYQNISEEIIQTALDASDSRFELFQIDDGYEEFVGDWMRVDAKKFPNGLKPLVDQIHAKGMKAGIWLAPLVAETNSWVFKTHPEWIKKDSRGELVYAGANWSKFYPLDLNNKEVIAYVKECLEYHMELGFDFFKLDFLYASALSGIEGFTTAEATEKAYSFIRKVLGDKLILGCGALVSNCYERFDFLRIGPDVSLIFDDVFYMKYMHRERISTKVTLQNTIFRSPMNHHGFLNDPDVFLLRDNNITLTKEQKYALTKINALFGSLLMTSDNPSNDYDDDKNKTLDEALDLFRNAKVTSYTRDGDFIRIQYENKNTSYEFTYDTLKGVIVNG